MSSTKTRYNDDGTIRYWSVYFRQWITAQGGTTIPDQELAAQPEDDRNKMLDWMADHGVGKAEADIETITCDRCGRAITEAEQADDWPCSVADPEGDATQDFQYVCPDCYGPEAE